MSRPTPTPPASTPGTPRPSGSGGANNLHIIVQNLPNLFQMHEKGTLSDVQIGQLRVLMQSHVRQITANALTTNKENPLYKLPDAINPTLPWKNQPALLTKEAYEESIKAATRYVMDMANKVRKEKEAAALANGTAGAASAGSSPARPPVSVNTGGSGSGPGPAGSGGAGAAGSSGAGPSGTAVSRGGTPMSATSSGTSVRPAPAPAPSVSAPSPAPSNVTAQSSTSAVTLSNAPATPTAARGGPPPPGLMTHAELTYLAKLTAVERTKWLSKDPARQTQFRSSINYWQNQPKPDIPSRPGSAQDFRTSSQAPHHGGPNAAPNSNPNQHPPPNGSSIAATTPNPSASASFATAVPDARGFALRPPPQPPTQGMPGGGQSSYQPPQRPAAPPVPPPEPEHLRRKRVFRQMAQELMPGIELEAGMDELLGQVMDHMIEQGLEGAARLAKHRGGDKVELKDMARYIEQAWDVVVPGFDAKPHQHVHVAPEREKKKAKVVAPKAAKLSRAADE
ncbi:hypothetical protein IAT38_001064 [Cryptococcus sp. DSM 104549]